MLLPKKLRGVGLDSGAPVQEENDEAQHATFDEQLALMAAPASPADEPLIEGALTASHTYSREELEEERRHVLHHRQRALLDLLTEEEQRAYLARRAHLDIRYRR